MSSPKIFVFVFIVGRNTCGSLDEFFVVRAELTARADRGVNCPLGLGRLELNFDHMYRWGARQALISSRRSAQT